MTSKSSELSKRTVLSAIEESPLTKQEISDRTGYSIAQISGVLSLNELCGPSGTVGWFNTHEANMGCGTVGMMAFGEMRHYVLLGWLANDMLGISNIYSSPQRSENITRRIEQFMAGLLRPGIKLRENCYMNNLQNYIAEVMLRESNRSALERFVTEELRLDLGAMRKEAKA